MRISFNLGDFYDLIKFVKVILHILGIEKEGRMNKTLKKLAIATFSRR